MKKAKLYMINNRENNARIILPYLYGKAIIFPGRIKILRSTAHKVILALSLKEIPSYKDFKNHDVGSTMFIFKEHEKKYQ